MKPQQLLVLLLASLSCAGNKPVFGGDLKLTETDAVIRVTLRDKPVLEYVKKEKPVPAGIEPHFRRSGYIHPVYTPTGQEITGDFPADHAHQHALYFAWTKASFDGKEVDFWNQAKGLGSIEFREVLSLKQEERQVSFSVKHAFTVGAGEKRVDALHEIWTVTVHLTPADSFLFDIESVQECASPKPLKLPQYHYGGMAFRGNSQWLKEKDDHRIHPGDLQILTSEGKDRWKGNNTRPNWVAFSGKIEGQEVSATVFCSPNNFRAPQTVRVHPNKPYFCFAPMVDGSFAISPGEKYTSRYRYLVTSGAANKQRTEEYWKDYLKAEDSKTRGKKD